MEKDAKLTGSLSEMKMKAVNAEGGGGGQADEGDVEDERRRR